MKTREQLRAEGIELHGPIVPTWFKDQSDGCSVEPFRPKNIFLRRLAIIPNRAFRIVLRAEQARAACYIHDFRYYINAIQNVGHSPDWVGSRMRGDYELKQNRALVGRNKFFGWAYSRMYYRAVRVGGKYAMKLAPKLVIPPTLDDIQALVRDHLHKPLTPQAEATIEKWIQLRDN